MANRKIHLIGGMSGRGRISFLTRRWTAHASIDSNGIITTQVVKNVFHKTAQWERYTPQIFRLLLFLFRSSTTQAKIILALALFALSLVLRRVEGVLGSTPTVGIAMSGFVLILGLLLVRSLIAPWHAAEHMGIDSMEKGGTLSVDRLSLASRIHHQCGGRLLTPFFLSVIAPILFFPKGWGIPIMFLLIEATLWVDELWGWDTIPIASHASVLLQQYVTTSPPTKRHLEVAFAALKALHQAERRKRGKGRRKAPSPPLNGPLKPSPPPCRVPA